MSKVTHREYDGPLESNIPLWSRVLIDALFDESILGKPEWTHSGMAWAISEKLGITDLEELVYFLNEEIKKRKEADPSANKE